ncbi:hypothetical protein [Arthrobacter sp. ISL-28]|uniref:hypothetical protein n=1 Tax=Arthrobacter sp. ISL-28 TaxID=2819108 RepID=UPI001BE993BD|nr:hypothetical protein [Arthrobacter sp. ISL-28]MBT2522039.1 hypothetical protein [Arthrobacter sp. ISL-28]
MEVPIWWGNAPSAHRRSLLVLSVAFLAFLTGCTGQSGGTWHVLSTAVGDSASAIAAARLALGLDSAGKLTTAATSTALDDALRELQASRDTVLRLTPSTPEDRAVRQETLTVLDTCAAGLTTARDAVFSGNGSPSLADGDRALKSGADSLSQLKTKVDSK